MANIIGIIGFNKSSTTSNKLLAAYGSDIIDVSTGLGTGITLTSINNVEFEAFADRIFFQNYNDRPRTYNGTAWTTEYVRKTPNSKYQKKFKSRLYLANCIINSENPPLDNVNAIPTFPSRVFYSDPFLNNQLTWGIDWGRGFNTYANSPIVDLTSDAAIRCDFKAHNIKVGDPFFVTSRQLNVLSFKDLYVSEIPSELRLIMTENFKSTSGPDQHFWVGGNWFDVNTDDNDQITGLGENSDRLLIFKLLSLWYYTGNVLKQVKDAVGTSSNRSIINSKGYTYYFHGSHPFISGIYRFDGVSSIKISRGIDPFIRGMSASNYTSVVGWKEGDELRWYVGNLTNTNFGISMNNAVVTLHTVTGAIDVSPIQDIITCATTYRTSNQEDTYCGTSDNQVLKMNTGNNFNGTAISANLDTKVYYPDGTGILNKFVRIQVIGKFLKGMRVKYKLWNYPTLVDDEWNSLGELDNDLTDLILPSDHNIASGIQLRFENMDILENDMFVEKISIFYKPEMTRLIPS